MFLKCDGGHQALGDCGAIQGLRVLLEDWRYGCHQFNSSTIPDPSRKSTPYESGSIKLLNRMRMSLSNPSEKTKNGRTAATKYQQALRRRPFLPRVISLLLVSSGRHAERLCKDQPQSRDNSSIGFTSSDRSIDIVVPLLAL